MSPLVAVAFFTPVCFAGSAAAQISELKWENDSGGYVQIYGGFHPVIVSFDDGQETNTELVDNDLENSRIGLLVVQPWGENEFQFRFETGLALPNSTEVDQNGDFFDGWEREDIRHIDFSLEGSWGKVSLGQGSMASDGAAETDLSYVGTTLYSFTADENASYIFRDRAGGLAGNPVVVDATDNFDGGRRTRVRYDTPSYNGFSAAVAWGENALSSDDDDTYYDIGLFYENAFANGAEFSAGLAYAVRDRDSGGDREDLIASASVLFANGLSLTAAAGTRDEDDPALSDPSYFYAKIGYEREWFSWGRTGIGIDYTDGEDYNTDGSDTEVWGVAIVQEIRSLNMDTYIKYRSHDFDEATASYESAGTWAVGGIFRF